MSKLVVDKINTSGGSLYLTGSSEVDLRGNTTGIYLQHGPDTTRPTPPSVALRVNDTNGTLEVFNTSEWTRVVDTLGTIRFAPGLAGKFFNGNWRSSIPGMRDGNVGGYDAIPLTTDNDSSNITGNNGQLPSPDHRYGVNIWPFIDWTTNQGDLYGGIWIGYFFPPSSGTYTFWTAADDGSGAWFGDLATEDSRTTTRSPSNALLNNNIGGGQGRVKRSGSGYFIGGNIYPIRIIWEEVGGGDNMTFTYAGPGIPETRDLTQHFKCRINNDGTPTGDF